MSVRWSKEALADLEEIHEYIRQDSPDEAGKFIDALIGAAERLETFPRSGRLVPEYSDPILREVLHSTYRIIYRLLGDAVEIVTVIHGAKVLPF